jgi:hypothetical protein
MRKVLIVLSHQLTTEQIETLAADKLMLIGDVAPSIAAAAKQIDPTAKSEDILLLARQVVEIAIESKMTHIVCQGEPTFMMLTNMLAHKKGLTLLQSTTRRKSVDIPQEDGSVVKQAVVKHVQWRKIKLDLI